MRKLPIAVLLLLAALVVVPAKALSTDDLLGLVAMPLAVDAVSNVTGVPTNELSDLVVALNQADVPPTQFVEVIRYVPVALVAENDQPTFVQFVRDETARGVRGNELVTVITQRLRTYDISPDIVTTMPATTLVVANNYIPAVVVTRVTQVRTTPSLSLGALDTNQLLALIAMPLAVDAVSRLTGVPQSDLASFVATLNQADVAPVQVVEVLRYVPVALVQTDQPSFVQFVQQQVTQGVTGPQLITVINRQLQTFDVTPVRVTAPAQVVVVDDNFIPPVVITRMATVKVHPHGGPPGQLKKQLGVQTGAEIVHGGRQGKMKREEHVENRDRGRGHGGEGKRPVVVVAPQPMISGAPPPAVVPPGKAKHDNEGKGKDGGEGKQGGEGKGSKGKGKKG